MGKQQKQKGHLDPSSPVSSETSQNTQVRGVFYTWRKEASLSLKTKRHREESWQTALLRFPQFITLTSCPLTNHIPPHCPLHQT